MSSVSVVIASAHLSPTTLLLCLLLLLLLLKLFLQLFGTEETGRNHEE